MHLNNSLDGDTRLKAYRAAGSHDKAALEAIIDDLAVAIAHEQRASQKNRMLRNYNELCRVFRTL